MTWTTSDLRQLDGTEGTGARDDFNTVAGSLTDDSTFNPLRLLGTIRLRGNGAWRGGAADYRYQADLERTLPNGPRLGRWQPTAANSTGTGSATWRGIAEAASTDDFQRLTGTANLRIPDLSQPWLTAELRWPDISLTNGSF